ncbi:electron transport complex subunit RsxC [Shewanella sp. KT0246]|uniref:electron transport complex subunit RsxC n=1 Tax=Shewanella sp. KT0246 TaxID=2815912 RepID=UPI001BBBC0E4|nr:electron transport complex subunit RsxC [Shewanella sp. KT0246]GIU52843.1 electron transport complex subunit C [Shewanella sp. KT0246]
MLTLLEQIDKGTLWHSPGGIHPPQLKSLSNQTSTAHIAPAKQYRIPLPQVGDCARLSINVGDKVAKGQKLTDGEGFMYLPVHSPVSGVVNEISLQASNHASGLPTLTCVIDNDELDAQIEYQTSTLEELSNQQILEKIKQAGIAGMGGATFPSHIKLNPASEIDLVIINGVECEPYITSDDVLMRENALEIFKGIQVINQLLTPQRIIVAIEDNKPEACASMQQCLNQFDDLQNIVKITVIPTKYPSGGEKQLIQIITGREVPTGSIPAQQGIVVHNVGTAYAIQDAVLQGKPLIERLVTLTGEQIKQPGNYWLPIGTSVEHALSQVGFSADDNQKVIIGGPMMGYALPDNNVPVLKGTNCILAPSAHEIAPEVDEKACIRCGECAVACPALLLPQQLFWHAKAEEYDKAASFNLKDCIECGCCSFVCPSDIPLVEYYRIAKSALKNEAEEKQQAEQAKVRFEARLKRLDDEKRAREEKSKLAAEKRKAAANASSNKNTVAEAMARVAAKKQAAEQAKQQEPANGKSAAVKAAIERAKAKKLANQSSETADSVEDKSTSDNQVQPAANDKKAQIAAAVARAKAKKLAQKNTDSNINENVGNSTEADIDTSSDAPSTEPVDDKKAKIAAAVARAKAKKLAQKNTDSNINENVSNTVADANINTSTDAPSTEPVDDKKAKIAAAVARAKAKKLAQQNAETDLESENATIIAPVDEKKAKIAAAVARAKAKKLAQLNAENETVAEIAQDNLVENNLVKESQATKTIETPDITQSVDDKKARIAAAVAKAKAKKLANQQKLSEKE